MKGALIILLAMVIVGVVLYVWHLIDMKKHGEESVVEEVIVQPEECCGQHEICEKDLLLSLIDKEIVYYEDEELDAYKGKFPEDYTDEQIEQFRNVLYTLRPEEVAGWSRSIQLRGILFPDEIREEVLMIVSEQREKAVSNTKENIKN